LEKGLIVEADFQFIQHEHKAKHLALAKSNKEFLEEKIETYF
jgi:hypothetical protein